MKHNNSPLFDQLEQRIALAAATINFNDVHQSVDGFGASTAWSSVALSQTVLDQLYSPTLGAGLSLHRSRIGPNGVTSETTILQQLAPYGIKTWSTPWTPPREWKINHDNNHGGTLDPSHYQDYANLLSDYITRMASRGVTISAVSLQNEPDENVSYESCLWTDKELAAFLPIVGQTFSAKGITAKIILPENTGWEFERANLILADPGLSQYVGIIAAHNYNRAFAPYATVNGNGNIPLWETEVYFSETGSSEIGTAVTLAQDIQTAFKVAGVSAYHYWWVKSTADQLMTNSYAPTKRLWSMGQFSKFIRPGWVLTGETDDGGITVASFKDPVSGKFAIISVNSGATSITETYSLNGITTSKVTPYITSSTAGDDLKQYADITVAGGSFSGTIAPNSIVTYYGQSSAAAVLIAPTNLRAKPQYTFQTSRMALSWDDNSSGESAYTVERSLDGSTWTVLTSSLAANTTAYVDTTSSESTLYYYRVRATNGASVSSYSNIDSDSTVLDAPTNLNGTTITNGRNLTWTINSAASTGVIVERSIDGLLYTAIATLNTRATSYSDTIPGYNANQIYYYRVRNTKGSVQSGTSTFNTGLKTPTNFVASSVGPTSITFTWTNNAVGASGAVIEQFNSSTSSWSGVSYSDLQASDGTYTLSGLAENTSYTFRFKVMSAADSVSSSFTASIVPTTPIAPPSNLTAVSTGANSAQLNWTINSSAATSQAIERSTDGTNWTVLDSALAAGTSTFNDLTAPSGAVYYRVKAQISATPSAYIRTQLVSSVPTITASPSPVTGTTTTLSLPALSGFGSGALTYTWSLDGTAPGSVSFSSNSSSTSNSTIATFSAVGSYTFRVRISDATGNITTATKAVVVNPTLTTITIKASSSLAFAGGAEVAIPAIAKSTWQQLVAVGNDQFGKALASQPTFTWSVISGGGSVSTGGLYTAPASAASPIVRATSGAVSGQATLSVLSTAQLKADFSFNEIAGYNLADPIASSISAKMSGTASLVTGRLGGGVNFTGSESSVYIGTQDAIDIRGQITMAAWIKPQSSSATQIIVGRTYGNYPNQAGTYLAMRGGKYAVGFYNGGQNYASFTIPAGDINTWVHLVGTYDGQTWRLYRNGIQVATAVNSIGAVYSYKAWRVGSSDNPNEYFTGVIDSVRLYSQALSATEISALYIQAISITSAAAATPATVNGATTNLSVAAVDPDSNSDSRFIYTWSLTGTPPASVTYSDNGTTSAKSSTVTFTKAGTYNFLVTITDSSGITSTSSVSVTVNQVLTSIAVTPASATIGSTATQQLTASARDQFGNAMTIQPTFTWSVTSGTGSVNTVGLYTAPAASGIAVVTATSGLISGNASISVVNAVPTIVTAASASPNPVSGSTTTLSVLGGDSDGGGEANLIYTWSLVGTPPGSVSYSRNGTNAAKSSLATFSVSGTYNFIVTITDLGGAIVTSSVSVVVNIPSTTGSISGQIFEDRNSDSVLGVGEPTMNGVTVYLDANNNSIFDPGESSVISTGSGNYSFTNLPAGTYLVRHVLSAGYISISSPASVLLGAGVSLSGKNFADFPTSYVGTSGNDDYLLRVNGARFDISIGGILTYSVPSSLITTLSFDGGAGIDSFQMQGASAIDAMSLSSASSIIRGGKTFSRSNFENLILQSGNYSISANLGAIGLSFTSAIATFTQTQTLGSLALSNGSTVTSASTNSSAPAMVVGNVSIDNSILNIAANGGLSGVSQFSSLNLAGTGKVELHDNDLVINYGTSSSPYVSLMNNLKTGLTMLGGSGLSGITSYEVEQSILQGTILAIVDDGDSSIGGAITSTSGFNLSNPSQSIIIKYTWFGDSNLDGVVDGSDYALLDSGFTSGGSLKDWIFGDYDYSGVIDGSDYALIDTGFISQNRIL